MDLRKKTNPFVENAKAIEFRRKAAMRQQQMTPGKTAAQDLKKDIKQKKDRKLDQAILVQV